MKKLSFSFPVLVLVLTACDKYSKYDSVMAGCERIAQTARHLVYKCPADQGWIANVKNTEPNAMFITVDGLALDEMLADTEHVYAEIVFNDNSCPQGFSIRTMTRTPNPDTMWAVLGCE